MSDKNEHLLPEPEQCRLGIAKDHIDYLIRLGKQHDIRDKSKLNDKKLLYDVIFCLNIVGECFHADRLPRSYAFKNFSTYASKLYLLRDRFIHYFSIIDDSSKGFKIKYESFLEALANCFKDKKGFIKIQAILSGLLRAASDFADDTESKLIDHVKSKLINISCIEKTGQHVINLLKKETLNFETLVNNFNFNDVNKDPTTYHALLTSFQDKGDESQKETQKTDIRHGPQAKK